MIPAGNPITFVGIEGILNNISYFLGAISLTVLIIALILSGLLMVVSGGNPDRFKAGRAMLKTTIWGAIVIFGVDFIIVLLTSTFSGGINLSPIEDVITYVVLSIGNFLVGMSTVVMVVFIVISGVMMATAGDNQERFKSGRQMLRNVVLGSLVVLGAGVILNTIYALVVTREFFCQFQIVGICILY